MNLEWDIAVDQERIDRLLGDYALLHFTERCLQ